MCGGRRLRPWPAGNPAQAQWLSHPARRVLSASFWLQVVTPRSLTANMLTTIITITCPFWGQLAFPQATAQSSGARSPCLPGDHLGCWRGVAGGDKEHPSPSLRASRVPAGKWVRTQAGGASGVPGIFSSLGFSQWPQNKSKRGFFLLEGTLAQKRHFKWVSRMCLHFPAGRGRGERACAQHRSHLAAPPGPEPQSFSHCRGNAQGPWKS